MNGAWQPDDAAIHVIGAQIVIDVFAAPGSDSVGGIFDDLRRQAVVNRPSIIDCRAAAIAARIIDIRLSNARIGLIANAGVVLSVARRGPFLPHTAAPNLALRRQSRLPP